MLMEGQLSLSTDGTLRRFFEKLVEITALFGHVELADLA